MAKEKEEKEQKPKKAFEIKVIVWEDGEIDSEMYEYRQNPSGRGAPGKWRLSANDFVRRVEESFGDPQSLLDQTYDAIGGVSLELKENQKQMIEVIKSTAKPKKVEEAEKVKEIEKEEPEEKDDKDFKVDDNMDFGEFDKDKNK